MLEFTVISVSVVLNLLLGVFVFVKNPRSATHRLFFALTVAFVCYTTINYFSLHPIALDQLSWIRLDLFAGAFMFLFAYLTFEVFPNSKFGRPSILRKIAILYTIFAAFLTLTPLVFSRLDVVGNAVQPVPTPAIALFALQQVALLIIACVTLIRRYKASRGLQRAQYRYVVFGTITALSSVTFFNFILVQVFKVTQLVSFGPLGILVFTVSFTYAIARHRLLNIRAVVARSVAYFLVLAAMAVIYISISILVPGLILPPDFVVSHQTALYTVTAIILAFTFQPLRRYLEQITDGVFFHDRYDSPTVLNTITSVLASELHLEIILSRSLDEVKRSLRVAGGQFVVLEGDKTYYEMHSGPQLWDELSAHDIRTLDRGILVTDELDSGIRKDLLTHRAVRVSLALRTKEELVGYLFLGDKLSGEIYSDQDLKLLEILRKELAVAIVNAKAYEEIERFNATLQERVTEATAHLRAANKKLKILDKTKDDFISMASHQLGTPLTAVTGYLSMALDEDKKNMTTAQHEYVTIALESSERLVNMAGDLLNVSRLNAGRFNILLQPVDLNGLIEDEVQQLEPSAKRKGLYLSFTRPAQPLPDVPVDESKTRQVVMNFIDNAIYYTQKGGVNVSLQQVGDQVELKVTDTGMGVPPEERSKLFSKFYRAENAKSARPDGTGLGLYLAKQVIEGQSGEIIFETELGKGSTFGFRVPLKPTPKTEATTVIKS